MRKKPRRSPAAVFFGGVFYGVFLLFALGAGTFYGWIGRSSLLNDIVRHPLAFLDSDPKQTFRQDALNVLILGCDEDRYYRGVKLHGSNIIRKYARSDMMMLARLDFDNNQITALSIPRDTKCKLPGYPDRHAADLGATHKINAYHALAPKGEENQVTQEAVEHILPGVKVDRVIVLDFDAFQQLVDSVGGVDVDVPKAMNYDDDAGFLHIHLKPGFQHLNGYNAMCFVRFRHDQESDFGRQARQKDFLMSFKQQAFRNIVKLPELANQGKAVLNGGLNDDEILALVAFMRKVPPDHIKMGTVPVVDGPGSFLLVDKARLPGTLSEFGFLPYGGELQAARSQDDRVGPAR